MSRQAVRFAAVLGTIDEADILPATIEQLRSIGVGRIIVHDHGSSDATLDYLAEAETAGDIWLWRTDRGEPAEVSDHIRAELARASGAEWVLFLDSDELWLPATGSLDDISLLDEADVVSVMRYNVVLGPNGPMLPRPRPRSLTPSVYGEVLLYGQPIRDFEAHMRREPDTPWIRGVLEPKVMARPEAIAVMQGGDHGVDTTEDRSWRHVVTDEVLIAHLPFRTLDRFKRRSRNMRTAISLSPQWYAAGNGWQWTRFAAFSEAEQDREEFERQLLAEDDLARMRSSNIVRSVAEILEEPLPELASEEEYLAAVVRAQPWLTLAGRICRIEGVETRAQLEHISDGHRAVVYAPPDHVVKFYAASWKNGRTVRASELAVLEIMARDPDLPASRLVAQGELNDEWLYAILSWLPGVPLADVRQSLRSDQMPVVATWLGDYIRRLHAIPLEPTEREAAWQLFSDEIRRRHTHATRIITDRNGLPRHLAEQLDDWLPPLSALLGSVDDAVVTHGDLNDEHLLGLASDGRFEPTGVIDMGEALLGHPLYDLGPIWWCILRGDRDLLAMFLEAAEVPGTNAPGFPRHALTWALIHPCWQLVPVPGIESVASLDELAERMFGDSVMP